MFDCLRYCDFDSDAFGLAYWRVIEPKAASLAEALAALPSGPAVVEVRIPSSDTDVIAKFESLGFHRVCTQFILLHSLKSIPDMPPDVTVADTLHIPENLLLEHANNFKCDRVSLEKAPPDEGRVRFYRNWLFNSLTLRRHRVVYSGVNLVTFSVNDESVVDLVSILDKNQGIGRKLMDAVIVQSAIAGARRLKLGTICENSQAWRLYIAAGFQPHSFNQIMYLVRYR